MAQEISFTPQARTLEADQAAQLWLCEATTGQTTLLYASKERFEAPNWTPDGSSLVVNAGGLLWRLAADGTSITPQAIDTGAVTRINNDHVLAPDGRHVYLSNGDGHLYRVAIGGGTPETISNAHDTAFTYYLHGISPDGETLSYVGVRQTAEGRRSNIFTIPADGGPDTQLTDHSWPEDGPEYSPDGTWIYFNSERAATRPGHAQIFRMRPDGSGTEQITDDERVNWFPHFSPDGAWIVYLSYPPGTEGHPADREVILRRMRPDGSQRADLVTLPGGQGTINVNSWSPDGHRFAYVAYPRNESR